MSKIAIIGAGNIGAAAAKLFVNAGHDVAVSNSRGPSTLTPLVNSLGPHARAMTVADGARWADIVLLAVPWRSPEALPPADAVAGKIVIDAMNPYGCRARASSRRSIPSTSSTSSLAAGRICRSTTVMRFSLPETTKPQSAK